MESNTKGKGSKKQRYGDQRGAFRGKAQGKTGTKKKRRENQESKTA